MKSLPLILGVIRSLDYLRVLLCFIFSVSMIHVAARNTPVIIIAATI